MSRAVGTPAQPSSRGCLSSWKNSAHAPKAISSHPSEPCSDKEPASHVDATQQPAGEVHVRWTTVTGRRGRKKLPEDKLNLLLKPDSSELLNFLGLDDADEALNAVGEEPDYIFIEICLDSGAGDHVLARIDVPGFTVEESPASRAGRGLVAANNKKIANEGQTTVRMLDKDGRGLRSVFQVAEVSRPLWSVGKICDAGFRAKFSKDKAVITDEAGREVLVFERKQGLYLGLLQVRNPKFKPKNESGFPRPSR